MGIIWHIPLEGSLEKLHVKDQRWQKRPPQVDILPICDACSLAHKDLSQWRQGKKNNPKQQG